MSARTRRGATASLLGAIAILALAVTPVLAKEGAIANLDTVVHRDAQPGSTVTIGFSVVQLSNDKPFPIYGSPVILKVVGPDGSANEVPGREAPAGSGHYLASVVVPAGGIEDIVVSLRGEACYDGGNCQKVDYVFPLNDDRHVVGDPVGFTAPAASAASTTPAAAPSSVSNGLVPLIAIGIAFALGGGLAALVVTRRRQVGAQPTGR